MMKLRLLTVVTVLLAVSAVALACEWDYDTLQMERQRFPETLELITGKFLRHSKPFYEWRIEDRKERLKVTPKLEWHDDLAVAYDKTGQQQLAIETVKKNYQLKPRRYETEANLGTFYIHQGDFEQGIHHLTEAIAINEKAHFNRERYQLLLAQYVRDRIKATGGGTEKADAAAGGEPGQPTATPAADAGKAGDDASPEVEVTSGRGVPLPLDSEPRESYQLGGFAKYVFEQREVKVSDAKFAEEADAALKGVLGMLRFGAFDSPILLEAAGDLLLADPNQDGKRLAARAYLKASMEVASGSQAEKSYLQMAEEALSLQTVAPKTNQQLSLAQLRVDFDKELKEADDWYEEVRRDELRWIAAKLDVDAEFTKKYYNPPEIEAMPESTAAPDKWPSWQLIIGCSIFAAIALGLVGYAVVLGRR